MEAGIADHNSTQMSAADSKQGHFNALDLFQGSGGAPWSDVGQRQGPTTNNWSGEYNRILYYAHSDAHGSVCYIYIMIPVQGQVSVKDKNKKWIDPFSLRNKSVLFDDLICPKWSFKDVCNVTAYLPMKNDLLKALVSNRSYLNSGEACYSKWSYMIVR